MRSRAPRFNSGLYLRNSRRKNSASVVCLCMMMVDVTTTVRTVTTTNNIRSTILASVFQSSCVAANSRRLSYTARSRLVARSCSPSTVRTTVTCDASRHVTSASSVAGSRERVVCNVTSASSTSRRRFCGGDDAS